jgi:hypothetical protein
MKPLAVVLLTLAGCGLPFTGAVEEAPQASDAGSSSPEATPEASPQADDAGSPEAATEADAGPRGPRLLPDGGWCYSQVDGRFCGGIEDWCVSPDSGYVCVAAIGGYGCTSTDTLCAP